MDRQEAEGRLNSAKGGGHPHKEVMKAWLEGATVQVRVGNNARTWRDLADADSAGEWPLFSPALEFRVKPEPRKVFVCLMRSPLGAIHAMVKDPSVTYSSDPFMELRGWVRASDIVEVTLSVKD